MNEINPELDLTADDIRLFIQFQAKIAYCYVPVTRMTEVQAAPIIGKISYLKKTIPSCWALRVMGMWDELGKECPEPTRLSCCERLRGHLPPGFQCSWKAGSGTPLSLP